MARCPECSFILVEKYRRYKCSVCKKFFNKKEVDSMEFRELNEKIRKEERRIAKNEAHREWSKFNKTKLKQYRRKYAKTKMYKELTEKYKNERKLTHYSADYRESHKEEIREKSRDWYLEKRERLLNGFKEYHRNNRDSIMGRKKAYYALNRAKILDRMKVYYLTRRNKDTMLKSVNEGFKACSPEIPNKEPTFALSEVLFVG